jgi:pantoate--beta-alanine ligase
MTLRVAGGLSSLSPALDILRHMERPFGLVPTMGYLHEGHLALIRAAREAGCATVVTVFVNPTQFAPGEDFASYPRDEKRDFRLASHAGADLVWFPKAEVIYPAGWQTSVLPGALAKRLCGLSRPHFFGGVCSVVLRLFQIIQPQHAWFGEKDFQQLVILRRMVVDFFLPVTLHGMPTVREPDGLAMSSRNARLAPERRDLALTLWRCICRARQAYGAGRRDAATLLAELRADWPAELGLDYMEFRDPKELELQEKLGPKTRLFLAAWLDGVRLIDNSPLE